MKVRFLFVLAALFTTNLPAFSSDDPVADKAATVISGNARFTVLGPRLIRMEWAEDSMFEDNATLGIVNRKLPVPRYSVRRAPGRIEISTDSLKLVYRGNAMFGRDNLEVSFRMKDCGIMRKVIWHPGDDDSGNLLGTTRTLDSCDGEKTLEPFDKGVVSRDGWAVIDESSRHRLVRVDSDWKTWVECRPEGLRQDLYFFAYGHDYRSAVSDFTKISGKAPLPPKYAFGYWWSRYWQYSDYEIEDLCAEIRSYGIPIDVMILDMDWHEVYTLKLGGCPLDDFGETIGWSGYTWQKQLFPHPEDCMESLHRLGVKTGLNLHFNNGIETFEEPYERFVKDYLSRTSDYDGPEGYVYGEVPYKFKGVKNEAGIPGQSAPVPFRIDDIDFADAYFNSVIRPLEAQGVDFWWQDWQQWIDSRYIPGLSNTFWINRCFFDDKVRQTEHQGSSAPRPMIYHRWGGIGSHRYPVAFSGDTYATWAVLSYLPYFTSTASNVAYGYWGHDIGGFKKYEGMKATDPELYTRWLQNGVFMPIFKTHSTKDPVIEKRFWMFPEYFPSMRDAIRLRYSLSPYIYGAARDSYDTGISICRPLYYDYPAEDKAYTMKQEYMFGDDILATVVCEPVDSITALAERTIWFPEGCDWYDVASGRMFKGGSEVTMKYTIEENPWYVKAGAIIPMASDSIVSLQEMSNELKLFVAPGNGHSETSVYEDDGMTQAYVSEYSRTKIVKDASPCRTRIVIGPRMGNWNGAPDSRRLSIVLEGVFAPETVTFNGMDVKYSRFADVSDFPVWTYDGTDLAVEIYLPEKPVDEEITVEVIYPEHSPEQLALLNGAKGKMKRMKKFASEAKMAFGTYVDRICKMPDSFLGVLQCCSFINGDPENAAEYLAQTDVEAAANDLEVLGKLPPEFLEKFRALLHTEPENH